MVKVFVVLSVPSLTLTTRLLLPTCAAVGVHDITPVELLIVIPAGNESREKVKLVPASGSLAATVAVYRLASFAFGNVNVSMEGGELHNFV